MTFELNILKNGPTKDTIFFNRDGSCTETGYHITMDNSKVHFYRRNGRFQIYLDKIKIKFPDDEFHCLKDGLNYVSIEGHVGEVLERRTYRENGEIELTTRKGSDLYISENDFERLKNL
ncbi:MAG: hypothetical protein AAB966_03100 [Patescibacteria group bacterium]